MDGRLSHCLLTVAMVFAAMGSLADEPAFVLEFNGALTLEVAISDAERARGLSHRALVPAGTGMVFVHVGLAASADCFWMKDALAPLDAAFVDADGRIMHIATMRPRTRELHCPPAPAVWVIEAPAHWFRGQGFEVGMQVGDDNLAKLRTLG